MQVTVSITPILSRVGAVLLLTVAVVLLHQAADDYERELTTKLSHRELLDYLHEGYHQSFATGYFSIAALSLVYIALVELFGAFIRMWVRLLSPQRRLEPVAVDSD